jgi:peptide/nickel transport system substrate-binding protein
MQTANTKKSTPIDSMLDTYRKGGLSRRAFMAGATAAGMSAAAATFLANGGNPAAAQTPGASPSASPAASTFERPTVGTEGLERGAHGELRILWWQAPTVLNPHLSGDTGTDFVFEPLMNYTPDTTLQPVLLEEVPTVENGLLAEDFSTVTLKLLPDLVWSDGEPVTANDIVFTWQWIVNPNNASTSFEQWALIESIEAVDDLTAEVTFKNSAVNWYDPFTGNLIGCPLPAHAFGNDPENPNDEFQTAPIGTGPFVLEEFRPNDQATYIINENYRNPDKPYFSRILVKGGGDAVAAGRSVLQVGDYDWAWNIQADPNVLADIEGNGELGELLETTGVTREALYINFSDPDTEVDGQRSEMNTPHPILSDKAVRQAIALGIDRALIAEQFYGSPEYATSNNLTGLDFFESPNTTWEYNPEEAARILDEAGWTMGDDNVRAKDGVALALEVMASVNAVRQQTQAVIKQNLDAIGFRIEIPSVDSTVFFDTTPGNTQGLQKMYFDIGLWSSGPNTAVPVTWMSSWYAGPNGENIAQESNGWQEQNVQRWRNDEYDSLFEQLRAAQSTEEAAELLIAMNDVTINDYAVIPLVLRPFFTAVSHRLQKENMAFEHPFVGYFWNIENWVLAEGAEPR